MDLLILIAITAFFGLAALSMIATRNSPSPGQVIVIRADQLKEREVDGGAGFGIFLLVAVIVGAIAFL